MYNSRHKSLTFSANKKRQEIILSQFTGMETTFYVVTKIT